MRRLSSSSFTPPATKEKQRRDRMKDLYSTLATLLDLQPHDSKSLPEFLDLATSSLTHLKERVERLEAWKDKLKHEVNQIDEFRNMNRMLKVVQVTESMDMKLEVNLIFMVHTYKKLVPFEVLRVIEQGGAKIMSASFNSVGHEIYCNVHAQAFQARLGLDAKLIESLLMELKY